MGCTNFRQEFRVRNFSFWHWSKDHFVASPWFSLPVFLTYRLLFATYFLAIWIWDVTNIELYPDGKYFIFFTNLTYTVATLYFVYGSILCIIELVKQCKQSRTTEMAEMQPTTVVEIGQNENQGTTESWVTHDDNLLAHHKAFWFIYTIAANVGVMLSIGYWTVIYDGEPIGVRNVSKHILNAVLMLVETVVSSVPVRLYHTVYAMIFSALYIAFTAIYWAAGGTDEKGNSYVYKALDWSNVNATITIIIPVFLVIITPLMQLLIYGLYKLRFWLETKFDPEPIGCSVQ